VLAPVPPPARGACRRASPRFLPRAPAEGQYLVNSYSLASLDASGIPELGLVSLPVGDKRTTGKDPQLFDAKYDITADRDRSRKCLFYLQVAGAGNKSCSTSTSGALACTSSTAAADSFRLDDGKIILSISTTAWLATGSGSSNSISTPSTTNTWNPVHTVLFLSSTYRERASRAGASPLPPGAFPSPDAPCGALAGGQQRLWPSALTIRVDLHPTTPPTLTPIAPHPQSPATGRRWCS
jgi:hypothetical protein